MDQDYPVDKIVVVDNGSNDGSPEQIRQTFPNVHVIELEKNIGLPPARNIGLNNIKSDLVLLVDDDVYLSEGALQMMVSAIQDTKATLVCPRIILHPEINMIQCDSAAIHFSGTLSLHHAYQPVLEHTPERKMAKGFIGACMLVERKILSDLGNFDEDYFIYFEDMELSFRLLALGYTICCEERAVVYHERGEGTINLSFRGAGSYPERRAFLNIRDRWLTMSIYYQARTTFILSPALFLYELAALVEVIRRRWLGLYFKAVYALIKERTSIMKRRKRWKSMRKVMDKDILIGGDLPLSRGFVEKKDLKLVRLLNHLLNLYWDMAKRWL